MIVIKEKTEERFLSRLKGIEANLKGVRAIHYKFSKLENANHNPLNEVVNEYFDGAYVYIFSDGDAIIISNLATLKIFEAANHRLFEMLGIADEGFSSIYDLEKSFAILNSIGRRKLEIKSEQDNTAQEMKENASKASLEPVTVEVDASLLSNLAERKGNRIDPEILIIEDDSFSRKLVCNALKKNFRVTQAENGKEGINSYLTYAPNIVFLDIDMPDMNGHEVLKKIVSLDPNSFVVMLSGNGNKENVLEAIKIGAKGFVAKPFTKDKLYEYVNKFKALGGV